jgi:hypothetical protein
MINKMNIDEQIKKLFGTETLEYFEHKQRGGTANQKGSRYEDFFSIMKLAELFYFLMNHPVEQDIKVQAQAKAFVDDLVISDELHSSQHHFQLKNTDNVNWGQGNKTISDDFNKQKQLNDKLEIQVTRTILVCSDQSRVEFLSQKIPTSIHKFAEVLFFPEAETLNQLILQHSVFKQTIENICFSRDSDKLQALATVILGHWNGNKATVYSAKKLLSELQKTFPNYLAVTSEMADLLPEVKEIFANIKNFSHFIENGYLSWKYASGLDSGTIPYPVNLEEFLSFQRAVIAKHPRQFSELEGIL